MLQTKQSKATRAKTSRRFEVVIADDGEFRLRDTMRRVMDEHFDRRGDREFINDLVFAMTPANAIADAYRQLLPMLHDEMLRSHRKAMRDRSGDIGFAKGPAAAKAQAASESTTAPRSAKQALRDPDGKVRFWVRPHEDGRTAKDIRECDMYEVELLCENALRRRTAADAEYTRYKRLLDAMREEEVDRAGELSEIKLMQIMTDSEGDDA